VGEPNGNIGRYAATGAIVVVGAGGAVVLGAAVDGAVVVRAGALVVVVTVAGFEPDEPHAAAAIVSPARRHTTERDLDACTGEHGDAAM
jgi:hypothetical protein